MDGDRGEHISLLERGLEWFGDIQALKEGNGEGALGRVGLLRNATKDESDRLKDPRSYLSL
jgi:hypothetical protein